MRRFLTVLAIVMLFTASVVPAQAREMFPPDPNGSGDFTADYMGEKILVDVFIVRPISLGASLIGLVGAAAAYPMASLSNSTDRVEEELIRKPWDHTFCRPVGDIDF